MKLTIVTPTYNRPEILLSLFETINISNEIEWIVVNDNSTVSYDNTINKIKEAAILKFKYIINDRNLMITKSINKAIDIASGEYLVYAPDKFIFKEKWFDNFSENSTYDFLVYEFDNANKIVKKKIKDDYVTYKQIFNKYYSDKVFIMKTSHWKANKFQTLPNEDYVPESVTFLSSKIKFKNTRFVLASNEYLKDGLTKNKRRTFLKNKNGFILDWKIKKENSKFLKKYLYIYLVRKHSKLKISLFENSCFFILFPILYLIFVLKLKKDYK